MRRLNYQYHMQLSFPAPVEKHHFTLRCLPIDDARQRIVTQELCIEPDYIGGYEIDSFGNQCIYGTVKGAHMHFLVNVTGIAHVDGSVPISALGSHRVGMFRYQTKLTSVGHSLMSLREMYGNSKEEIVKHAYGLMDVVYHNFKYESGITQVTTTAEEAAALGMGVCQDYAHILLALCRMDRIPCRYVAGMMIGEGASHAWVEVCNGKEWIALDPTHNRMADDTYIRISYGRDAQDCNINQGFFYGSSEQLQEIYAVVEEI